MRSILQTFLTCGQVVRSLHSIRGWWSGGCVVK